MNEITQTIRDLPESSRPYEKCLKWGPSVLSDSELLAVILRNGVQGANSLALANQILSLTKDTSYPGLLGLLHMSLPDLMKVNGNVSGSFPSGWRLLLPDQDFLSMIPSQ